MDRGTAGVVLGAAGLLLGAFSWSRAIASKRDSAGGSRSARLPAAVLAAGAATGVVVFAVSLSLVVGVVAVVLAVAAVVMASTGTRG